MGSLDDVLDVTDSLESLETIASRAASLLHKLSLRGASVVEHLLCVGEVDIRSDDDRQCVRRALSINGTLGRPLAYEYIPRSSVPRPYSVSRELPQRLYAFVSSHEARVAMCGVTDDG
eukprot:TRINITY_DN5769_c0_g1_i1.p1 TRINITY_DN5769_c0_g1~~TRINITY_DN5769_c0_g1_i1.p1  ORF type:complete len:118 (-),score=27.05 TRINITY_DN5769_c0_g1_i1:188-541(-)